MTQIHAHAMQVFSVPDDEDEIVVATDARRHRTLSSLPPAAQKSTHSSTGRQSCSFVSGCWTAFFVRRKLSVILIS